MGLESQYRMVQTDSLQRPWLAELKAPAARWSINVLVVEDDPADANLIVNVLERHSDVAAVHVMDRPDIALRLLANGALQPDLALVDIQMPRMNGFRFVERLRLIPAMADVPVAFLTTSRLASDVEAAKEASVGCYVVKPDSLADLRARLDVVIKRIKSGAWSSK